MDIEQIFSELQEVKREIFRGKVRNFQIAEHLSPFKGSGYELHSINEWQLGEPIQNIDWNLSLRTWPKKVYKVDRIEAKNAPVILVTDVSASLFVEIEEAKSRFKLLLHLVAALSFAANYFHDPVGVLAVDKGLEFYLRPKLGSGQIFYATQLLLGKAAEAGHKPMPRGGQSESKLGLVFAMEWLLGRLRTQCSIVLLSDFAEFISGESQLDFSLLSALSALHRWNVIAIFLDDHQEFDWKGGQGVVRVRNVETGLTENVRTNQAQLIREQFTKDRQQLRGQLEQAGIDSVIINFGEHFNQLSQFLSVRRKLRR